MKDIEAVSHHHMMNTSVADVLRRRAESLAHETVEDQTGDMTGVLLFRLNDEWYAIRVDEVREIYQEYAITPIPCVPDFILGVVNIRGEIISVTDIAKMMRFGGLTTELEVAPAIVVQNDGFTTAMVVDEIGDIVEVPNDGIEPPVSIMDKKQAEFIAGSICIEDRLVGLVNVDRILEPIGAPA